MYTLVSEIQRNNRLAHYGDAVFSTMLVIAGQIQLFPLHQKRLLSDTQRLGLPGPDQVFWQELVKHADRMEDGVLKVVLAAGVGGRGYQRPETLEPTAHLYFSDIPTHYESWRTNGITLGLSSISLAHQPLLAGIKHVNRLEQVLIKNELRDLDCDDVLVTDFDDKVIESSSANVFMQTHDGKWLTPELKHCGVAGVMRQHILDSQSTFDYHAWVQPLSIDMCKDAKSILICNALMGTVPVTQLKMSGDTYFYDVNPAIDLARKLSL